MRVEMFRARQAAVYDGFLPALERAAAERSWEPLRRYLPAALFDDEPEIWEPSSRWMVERVGVCFSPAPEHLLYRMLEAGPRVLCDDLWTGLERALPSDRCEEIWRLGQWHAKLPDRLRWDWSEMNDQRLQGVLLAHEHGECARLLEAALPSTNATAAADIERVIAFLRAAATDEMVLIFDVLAPNQMSGRM